MKKKLFLFIAFVFFGIMQAVIFMMANAHAFESYTTAQCLLALIYALPQSVMVAAWAMLPVFLVGLIYVFIRGDWHRKFMIRYVTLVFVPLLLLCCLDWVCYEKLGFRLDISTLRPIVAHPIDTLFSAPWWTLPLVLIIAYCAGWLMQKVMEQIYPKRRSGSITRMNTGAAQQYEALWYLLLTVVMGMVGSGCFGLMGMESSYYTDKQSLNHAAVNPIYSLCHGLRQHREGQMEEFHFLTDVEYAEAMAELKELAEAHPADLALWAQPMDEDSLATPSTSLLREGIVPNVLMIMLDGVSPKDSLSCLEAMLQQGVRFGQCYANDWHSDFTASLSLLAEPLEGAGYTQVNLSGKGLAAITFEELHQLLKEEALAAQDTLAEYPAQPYFKYYNTGSREVAEAGFEPFLAEIMTDTTIWNNLLLVVLSDCNRNTSLPLYESERYHMSMLWTGGAVEGRRDVNVLCQQSDVTFTLLHQLGIETSAAEGEELAAPVGHDIMEPTAPHYVFYTWPYGFGMLTDSCRYIQDNHYDGHPLPGSDDPTGRAERLGKALIHE